MAKIKIIVQRAEMDCGVACLAMLCRVPYETALAHLAIAAKANVLTIGSDNKEIKEAAKKLGILTKVIRKSYIPEEVEGVLGVANKKKDFLHYVYLYYGIVIDPADGTAWKFSEYFDDKAKDGTKAGSLIVEK